MKMLEAGYKEHGYNINMRMWNRHALALGFEHDKKQTTPFLGANMDLAKVKELLSSNLSIDLKASPNRLLIADVIDELTPSRDYPHKGIAGWLIKKLRAPIVKGVHFTFRVNSLHPMNNHFRTHNHSECHDFIIEPRP